VLSKITFQFLRTFKSPDMLAPAKIPVAAGKNMAKTEKKLSPSLKSGPKLVEKTSATKEKRLLRT
jgi:hypothetical protein